MRIQDSKLPSITAPQAGERKEKASNTVNDDFQNVQGSDEGTSRAAHVEKLKQMILSGGQIDVHQLADAMVKQGVFTPDKA